MPRGPRRVSRAARAIAPFASTSAPPPAARGHAKASGAWASGGVEATMAAVPATSARYVAPMHAGSQSITVSLRRSDARASAEASSSGAARSPAPTAVSATVSTSQPPSCASRPAATSTTSPALPAAATASLATTDARAPTTPG